MNIGDIKIRKFIHPDSIGVTVWEVKQLTIADGKYAKPGQTYWKTLGPNGGLDPFKSRKEAEEFISLLA